ncbi:MAG: HD domain-containing protein [Nanoarchaeota archaeon]|nr:HD domain-containing protein [Nanoarchaeota archaeon]
MKFNEKKYKKEAKKEIIKCRLGDWNHALRVVFWIKKLGIGRRDLNELIISGYIHDIGWKEVYKKNKLSFSDLKFYEIQANKNSLIFTRKFLSKFNFKETKIKKILRLIKSADNHEGILEDEKIIVDADNLSKLSIIHLKEKYRKEDWIKMIEFWKKEFPKRIKTKKGKSLYPILIKKLEKISPG